MSIAVFIFLWWEIEISGWMLEFYEDGGQALYALKTPHFTFLNKVALTGDFKSYPALFLKKSLYILEIYKT